MVQRNSHTQREGQISCSSYRSSSSRYRSRLETPHPIHTAPEIHPRAIRRHVLARRDAENAHAALVGQVVEEFGGDEEVLGASAAAVTCHPIMIGFFIVVIVVVGVVAVFERLGLLNDAVDHPARDANHAFVNKTFVARVHTLVDLIDDAEGRAGQGLQRHEVEDCADGTFAPGLAVGV